MLNENSPQNFSDPLPNSVDVVVIGAGVVGISTAWFLAERGVSVAVCEKGRVAGEQSSRNWGWIRKHGRDRAELPIVIESIEHWASIASALDEDIGFARHGVMYLAENDRELAERERWLDVAHDHDLDTRMIGGAELARIITADSSRWVGASYTPSDARAEPFLAVPAMARSLQKKDVAIIENCAVRTLDIAGGRVSGVVTEHGLIKCSTVVCAGGAWGSVFCRNVGYDFPQLTVRATVARTTEAPDIFQGNAASKGLSFRRRADGGYTLAASGNFEHFVGRDSFRYLPAFVPSIVRSRKDMSLRFGEGVFDRLRATKQWSGDDITPFERIRVLDPGPSAAALQAIRTQLKRQLPMLADIPLEEAWAGMIDTTPDIVPIMDRVEGFPGFFIATGFSGHGFGIGPGAGRVMADLVLGNPIGHDLTRFRLSRFREDGPLELGPAL
jgi:glycine/D-amino acid oxidase-like deaminating enzyme